MTFGWLPLTFILFSMLQARQAAIISLFFGWLFLPNANYDFPNIPSYTKIAATCLPIMLCTAFFNVQRLIKLSLGKLDIPILIWCFCPLASSLSNGLGLYDGISGVIHHFFEWGAPYAIGKMYFYDARGIRELAKWVVIGGLIYIPFCLWEMRMGANLHQHFYGFRIDQFVTTIRFGGIRPVVFFTHGIALGVWMMSSLLMGIWLWRTKSIQILCGFSMGINVVALFVVFLLCRSLNAIVLFVVGLGVYYGIRTWRWNFLVLILALLPIVYIASRNTGIITSDQLIETTKNVNSERAVSLGARLFHEEQMVDKAWNRPLFGWAGWGRHRLYNDYGENISITDAFWVLAFGINGLVGLISVGLVLLLPTFIFWRKYHLADWGDPKLAPIVGFVCIIPLYTIDCLMNAMINPIYTVAAGGTLAWLSNKNKTSLNSNVKINKYKGNHKPS